MSKAGRSAKDEPIEEWEQADDGAETNDPVWRGPSFTAARSFDRSAAGRSFATRARLEQETVWEEDTGAQDDGDAAELGQREKSIENLGDSWKSKGCDEPLVDVDLGESEEEEGETKAYIYDSVSVLAHQPCPVPLISNLIAVHPPFHTHVIKCAYADGSETKKKKKKKQKRRSSVTNLQSTDNDQGLRSAKVEKGRQTAASMHDPNIVLQGMT
jgi:hypothetical protein